MEQLQKISGLPYQIVSENPYLLVTDDKTINHEHKGMIFGIATDAKTFTLGSNTQVGDEFTFVNMGAAGNNLITISPPALEGIAGVVYRRQGTNADATTASGLVCIASGAVGKDFVNTKATSIQYDYVTIKKITTTLWLATVGVGIWASEA